MNSLDFCGAIGAAWDLMSATNAYIEASVPWKLHKDGDAQACAAVLGDCLESLRIAALLAHAVIPDASAELWRRLGFADAISAQRFPEALVWGQLPAGNLLTKGDPLFPRKDVAE